MSIPIAYDGTNGYVRGRAYANITCYGVKNALVPAPGVPLAVLIDTGADHLELPTGVASQLGINLATYGVIPLLTAGGTIPVKVVPNFGVEIENKLVYVTVHFLAISTGLLGLDAILKAVDFGFDLTQWLYKK